MLEVQEHGGAWPEDNFYVQYVHIRHGQRPEARGGVFSNTLSQTPQTSKTPQKKFWGVLNTPKFFLHFWGV